MVNIKKICIVGWALRSYFSQASIVLLLQQRITLLALFQLRHMSTFPYQGRKSEPSNGSSLVCFETFYRPPVSVSRNSAALVLFSRILCVTCKKTHSPAVKPPFKCTLKLNRGLKNQPILKWIFNHRRGKLERQNLNKSWIASVNYLVFASMTLLHVWFMKSEFLN